MSFPIRAKPRNAAARLSILLWISKIQTIASSFASLVHFHESSATKRPVADAQEFAISKAEFPLFGEFPCFAGFFPCVLPHSEFFPKHTLATTKRGKRAETTRAKPTNETLFRNDKAERCAFLANLIVFQRTFLHFFHFFWILGLTFFLGRVETKKLLI